MLDICAALHLHRVVVIGTSFGGLLGMGLAAARPSLVRAVVLNDHCEFCRAPAQAFRVLSRPLDFQLMKFGKAVLAPPLANLQFDLVRCWLPKHVAQAQAGRQVNNSAEGQCAHLRSLAFGRHLLGPSRSSRRWHLSEQKGRVSHGSTMK